MGLTAQTPSRIHPPSKTPVDLQFLRDGCIWCPAWSFFLLRCNGLADFCVCFSTNVERYLVPECERYILRSVWLYRFQSTRWLLPPCVATRLEQQHSTQSHICSYPVPHCSGSFRDICPLRSMRGRLSPCWYRLHEFDRSSGLAVHPYRVGHQHFPLWCREGEVAGQRRQCQLG